MKVQQNNTLVPSGHDQKVLEFIVDGKTFQSNSQYITGLAVKQLAGIPHDTELYLSIEHPWEDELISNNENVNLARPGIEYFFVRKKLSFSINGQPYTWYKQYIKGIEIRELAKIDTDDDIFLKIKEPFEDEAISNETIVDLARPGIEHFFSVESAVQIVLVVNGREKNWDRKTISFLDVVRLAFGTYTENGDTIYTVTYKRGPSQNPEGTIVKGDSVRVKNRMIFNVTATDKS